MLICKLDGAKFKNSDSAINHISDEHSDIIDERMHNYRYIAEERLFEEQIEEVEEE